MTNDKDHLNIDLDFLDKKEAPKTAASGASGPNTSQSKPARPVTTGYKYNWKNILIIGGVVLFFGWAIFSDSSGSSSSSGSSYTPTTNTTDSNNILTDSGETFRCSDSNYDRAMQLKPSTSLGAQLASESDTLDAQIAASKREKAAIEAMYVDENDQYAVDSYNERVDSYNVERQRLITAGNSWDQRHTAFSNQIDTYNNYLDTNCRPE